MTKRCEPVRQRKDDILDMSIIPKGIFPLVPTAVQPAQPNQAASFQPRRKKSAV